MMSVAANYGDDIQILDWKEHIRRRTGMYIGRTGDGTSADDGIYSLLKELLDNMIDPGRTDAGQNIEITLAGKQVAVRDCGWRVPLDKLADMAFKEPKPWAEGGRTGIRGINALSSRFVICGVSGGESRTLIFEAGNEVSDVRQNETDGQDGISVSFQLDEGIFGTYGYRPEHVEPMIRNYTKFNAGLMIRLCDQEQKKES